jgi:hypothetical protein
VENLVDLYTEFLISSPGGLTIAVSMSKMLKGQLSHYKITRFLSQENYDSKYLWQQVKPMIQELSSSKEKFVLSFDDSIEKKYYSDASELICWHYKHVFNRSVKGVNFLKALVNAADVRLPCAVESNQLISLLSQIIQLQIGSPRKLQKGTSIRPKFGKNTIFKFHEN